MRSDRAKEGTELSDPLARKFIPVRLRQGLLGNVLAILERKLREAAPEVRNDLLTVFRERRRVDRAQGRVATPVARSISIPDTSIELTVPTWKKRESTP